MNDSSGLLNAIHQNTATTANSLRDVGKQIQTAGNQVQQLQQTLRSAEQTLERNMSVLSLTIENSAQSLRDEIAQLTASLNHNAVSNSRLSTQMMWLTIMLVIAAFAQTIATFFKF